MHRVCVANVDDALRHAHLETLVHPALLAVGPREPVQGALAVVAAGEVFAQAAPEEGLAAVAGDGTILEMSRCLVAAHNTH